MSVEEDFYSYSLETISCSSDDSEREEAETEAKNGGMKDIFASRKAAMETLLKKNGKAYIGTPDLEEETFSKGRHAVHSATKLNARLAANSKSMQGIYDFSFSEEESFLTKKTQFGVKKHKPLRKQSAVSDFSTPNRFRSRKASVFPAEARQTSSSYGHSISASATDFRTQGISESPSCTPITEQSTPDRVLDGGSSQAESQNWLEQSPASQSDAPMPVLPSTAESPAVMKKLDDVLDVLKHLTERIEKTEKAVKELKMDGGMAKQKRNRVVPLIVRNETRKIYRTLVESDANFNGFVIGCHATFQDVANQAALCIIIKEVQGINPSFQACDIRDAAYTYYRTMTQQESAKRRGLDDERRTMRRRRERLNRKLQSRRAVLEKSSMQDKEKQKWRQVLVPELMSSDESEDDKIMVKTLPWRSPALDKLFNKLDKQQLSKKSSHAMRLMKKRIMEGMESSRPKPSTNLPVWSFT